MFGGTIIWVSRAIWADIMTAIQFLAALTGASDAVNAVSLYVEAWSQSMPSIVWISSTRSSAEAWLWK